jgi:hypothetical protein
MNDALISLVRRRAGACCEYCQLPEAHSAIPFEIDHIIAKKPKGATSEDNLALACFFCNSAKGPNIAGFDPASGRIVPLFHPRRQKWSRHFRWEGAHLAGLTRTGRATVEVLAINDPAFLAVREALIAVGVMPPR